MLISEVGLNFSSQVLIQFGFQDYTKSSVVYGFKPLCCCCSVTQSCPNLCDPMDCSTPGLPVPYHRPEFAQVHVHFISDAVQPSHPLMPSFPLPSIFSSISDFSNESAILIRWQRYWTSASASVLPTSIWGWFLLRLTGLLSLLSKGLSGIFSSTSLKASILWCSAFFMVQLSQPNMTAEKTIALAIWTIVSRVTSVFQHIV